MNEKILTIEDIKTLVRPVAEKYRIKEICLFGSYARGEACESSDLDFLVTGGEYFKSAMIFAFAEELRMILKKEVDVFEIDEIDKDSDLYRNIMKEKITIV